MKFVPYKVVSKSGKPFVEIPMAGGEKKSLSPTEVSSMILGKMKDQAEKYLGQDVNRAVITVPAYFNDA